MSMHNFHFLSCYKQLSILATGRFVTYIAVLGFGSGLSYMAGMVAVADYFDKWRPLAFGIATSAGGVANMCFPWISVSLIQHFGWRGALLISSGIIAQICVAATCIFPIQQHNACNNNTSPTKSNIKRSNHFISQTKEILLNGSFVLHSASTFLLLFTASVVYTHIAAYAESVGFNPNWTSLLITVVGAAALGTIYIPYILPLGLDH